MSKFDKKQNFQAFYLRDVPRRFSLLPQVVRAGFLYEKQHRVQRTFESCNFSFILSGNGTYVHQGRVIPVIAPCLILQWPGEPMDYGPDKTWNEVFLVYSADVFERFKQVNLMDISNPVMPISDLDGVHLHSTKLQKLLHQPIFDADKIDECAYSLFLSARTSVFPDSNSPARIARLEKFLSDKIGAPIDCEALAKEFGTSLSSLRRYWRLYHNTETFQDFRDAIFKSRACHLLVETDKPIHTIATELNFTDPFYFSRKFTTLVGMSPSKYRESNRIEL